MLYGGRITAWGPNWDSNLSSAGKQHFAVYRGGRAMLYFEATRYARSPSSRETESMRKPIFFLTAPLRKPRSECGCQPVAFRSSGSDAPVGLRSSASILAVLVPRRAAPVALLRLFDFLTGLAAAVAARLRRLAAPMHYVLEVREAIVSVWSAILPLCGIGGELFDSMPSGSTASSPCPGQTSSRFRA
jgi:hypothetical protein